MAAGGDAATFERRAQEAWQRGHAKNQESFEAHRGQVRDNAVIARELRAHYTQRHLRLNLLGPNAPSADSPLARAIIVGTDATATSSIRAGMTRTTFEHIRTLLRARVTEKMIANGFIEEGDPLPHNIYSSDDIVRTTGVWLEAESEYFRDEGTPADHLRYIAWRHKLDAQNAARKGGGA